VFGQDRVIFWYFGHTNCDYKAGRHSWKTGSFPLKSSPRKTGEDNCSQLSKRRATRFHPPLRNGASSSCSDTHRSPSKCPCKWALASVARFPLGDWGEGSSAPDDVGWCGCPWSLFCLIKRKLSVRYGCSLPIRHALPFYRELQPMFFMFRDRFDILQFFDSCWNDPNENFSC